MTPQTPDEMTIALRKAYSRITTAENRLKQVNWWLGKELSNEKLNKWANVRDAELAVIEKNQLLITQLKTQLEANGNIEIQQPR